MSSPVKVRTTEILSSLWGTLKKITFDLTRRDGRVETLSREVYDFGDGVAVLPYDARRDTVLLIRQFRLPPHLAGASGCLIEACAGLLDGDEPETCARREAEEELGYRLGRLIRAFTIHTSPGVIMERLSLFVAPYTPADRISAGGGEPGEGEDIEVLELPFAEALAMIGRGEIIDAKTILLLQFIELQGLAEPA